MARIHPLGELCSQACFGWLWQCVYGDQINSDIYGGPYLNPPFGDHSDHSSKLICVYVPLPIQSRALAEIALSDAGRTDKKTGGNPLRPDRHLKIGGTRGSV